MVDSVNVLFFCLSVRQNSFSSKLCDLGGGLMLWLWSSYACGHIHLQWPSSLKKSNACAVQSRVSLYYWMSTFTALHTYQKKIIHCSIFNCISLAHCLLKIKPKCEEPRTQGVSKWAEFGLSKSFRRVQYAVAVLFDSTFTFSAWLAVRLCFH